MTDHLPAHHLHPDVANILRDIHELMERLDPATAEHDVVLLDGLSYIGTMATNLLLGTHTDGRPLVGTQRHADRAAAAMVWDAHRVAWRPATTGELAGAIIVPGPGAALVPGAGNARRPVADPAQHHPDADLGTWPGPGWVWRPVSDDGTRPGCWWDHPEAVARWLDQHG